MEKLMPAIETATTAVIAKAGILSGFIAGAVNIATQSQMTSYIVGMVFAYIYAMNHKEFRVNLKEDFSVVAIGLFIVYFISSLTPKLLTLAPKVEELNILSELSNIIGVIIGTVILLGVKYWLTIRENVVKGKIDWAMDNKRLEKKEDRYGDQHYNERGYNDDDY